MSSFVNLFRLSTNNPCNFDLSPHTHTQRTRPEGTMSPACNQYFHTLYSLHVSGHQCHKLFCVVARKLILPLNVYILATVMYSSIGLNRPLKNKFLHFTFKTLLAVFLCNLRVWVRGGQQGIKSQCLLNTYTFHPKPTTIYTTLSAATLQSLFIARAVCYLCLAEFHTHNHDHFHVPADCSKTVLNIIKSF